jgi:hypothetical protein
MKVLLDERVPRKLRKEIANHEVRTVTESGWSGLKNGVARNNCLKTLLPLMPEVNAAIEKRPFPSF